MKAALIGDAAASGAHPILPGDCLEGSGPRQWDWILQGGLGPLLYRTLHRSTVLALPPATNDALLGSDLTARLRQALRTESALQVIDVCRHCGVPPVLLKGISVSEQLYPEEHLRPMADIDVLIPVSAYGAVESTLLAAGWKKVPMDLRPGLQHGAPLWHARRASMVELHTALFGADAALSQGRFFGTERVNAESVESRYHGRPVHRLSPEWQLAFIAASWFNDLTVRGYQPGFLVTLFDAAYLMAAFGDRIDWDRLLGALDNEMAAASLQALLTYLPRFGAAPAPASVLKHLRSKQRMMGALQLALMHAALDRHLIGARPWRHRWPPPMPGRYSLGHQIRKRLFGPPAVRTAACAG